MCIEALLPAKPTDAPLPAGSALSARTPLSSRGILLLQRPDGAYRPDGATGAGRTDRGYGARAYHGRAL